MPETVKVFGIDAKEGDVIPLVQVVAHVVRTPSGLNAALLTSGNEAVSPEDLRSVLIASVQQVDNNVRRLAQQKIKEPTLQERILIERDGRGDN